MNGKQEHGNIVIDLLLIAVLAFVGSYLIMAIASNWNRFGHCVGDLWACSERL